MSLSSFGSFLGVRDALANQQLEEFMVGPSEVLPYPTGVVRFVQVPRHYEVVDDGVLSPFSDEGCLGLRDQLKVGGSCELPDQLTVPVISGVALFGELRVVVACHEHGFRDCLQEEDVGGEIVVERFA